MTKSASCAVEPLLPVELGAGRIKFAPGVKAGRWVFATGLMAQDFVNGVAPDVLAERVPHAGLPKRTVSRQELILKRPDPLSHRPVKPPYLAEHLCLHSLTLVRHPKISSLRG